MADRKITDLTALAAGSQATGDLLTIVDVSESAAADKNKKITTENFFKGIPGDVGIGVSSPQHILHLHKADSGANYLQITNSTTGSTSTDGCLVGVNAVEDVILWQREDNNIQFGTNDAERMRVDNDGRLLIGTSSTTGNQNDADLLVTGSTQGELYLSRGSTPGNSGAGLGFIKFTGNNGVDAAEITCFSDGGTWTNGSSHPTSLRFTTTANGASSTTERARIDRAGRLLIGTTSSRSFATPVHKLQVEDADGAGSGRITIGTNNNTGAAGPGIYFFRSRGAALGSNTLVNGDDTLGSLFFQGADGNDVASRAAEIRCEVQGTPGADDMPGRLLFLTTENGGNSPAERLRIDRDGKISTGGESSPDCNGGGLCLDQNAGDGIILSFKSSDVSHGVTNFDQTDTYFSARKVSGAKGGLRLRAYTDAAGADPAFFFQGIINSDTDASYVPFAFQGGKANGATISNIATNRKIIDIRDSGGTSLASFTGTGLTFNGDTAADNALDDYEEGTWTPAFGATGGAFTSITYSIQSGNYTKIGNRVYIECRLQITAHTLGSASGGLLVTGLPYTVNSPTGIGGNVALSNFDIPASVVNLAVETRENAAQFYAAIYTRDNATFGNITPANLTSGTCEIRASAFYYTNS